MMSTHGGSHATTRGLEKPNEQPFMPNAAFSPIIGDPVTFFGLIPELATAFEKRLGRPIESLEDIRRDVLPQMTGEQHVEHLREALAAFAAWTRDYDRCHWRLGGLFRRKIISGSLLDAVELADYFYFQIVEGGRI